MLLFSLPLWKGTANAVSTEASDASDAHVSSEESSTTSSAPLTNRELLHLPGARSAVISFGCYCALESTLFLWTASYLVIMRNMSSADAANTVSLVYLGMTAGRFISGVVANRITSVNQIRIGQALIALGLAALVILPGQLFASVAIGLIGLGCAPIYPSIVALTPKRFGERASQGLVSLQVACAYTGSSLVPPLFGLIVGAGGAALVPILLAALLATCTVLCETTTARVQKTQ